MHYCSVTPDPSNYLGQTVLVYQFFVSPVPGFRSMRYPNTQCLIVDMPVYQSALDNGFGGYTQGGGMGGLAQAQLQQVTSEAF